MKRILIITGLATLAAVSTAQSRGSFQVPSSLTGITVTKNSAINFNVALSGTASMFYQGQTRKINNIFGFWLLDNNNDMHATGQNSGGWSYNQNYQGQGGIAGFKNTNGGIQSGGNKSFTFNSVQGTVEHYGFKVNLERCGTIYIEAPCDPVPEPASMAALGLGVAAMLRRRKKA